MACTTEKQYKFVMNNDKTDEKNITEEMLNTQDLCEARAKSEFLKHGYSNIKINFVTPILTMQRNQTIRVNGRLYLVKNITIDYKDQIMKANIEAVRYE